MSANQHHDCTLPIAPGNAIETQDANVLCKGFDLHSFSSYLKSVV